MSAKNLVLLAGLIASIGMMLAGRVAAQTLTTLHSFTATTTNSLGIYTNSDGIWPYASVVLSGNTLYGTAWLGGSSGHGTLFAINTDGTGFTTLHDFTAGFGIYPYVTNFDGALSEAGLTLAGDTLYGTAALGGSSAFGTVFKVKTDGTSFTGLYSFTGTPATEPYTNSDGASPRAGLILSGNTLYGTAQIGGHSGNGTVFRVNTDGTGFTNLHSFTATSGYPGPYTNSDGVQPYAGLILSGNTLYGTAVWGGVSGNGTVFRVNTDGAGFTNLHSFTEAIGPFPSTNSDGAQPYGGLVLSSNTLYGTASMGGSSGIGTLFAVNTDGTGFTNLHTFTARGPFGQRSNDGANPSSSLILSGNTLYGTGAGPDSSLGTVFAVHTDGTGFTNLYNFVGGSDGAGPYAGLILAGNTLYGTTQNGGSSGNGTVFSLSFTPQMTIIPSATNLILTWPTNYAGFDYTGYTLQSTTNLGSPVWTTNSPTPVVVNGQNTVTNPISGTQEFYRLSQ